MAYYFFANDKLGLVAVFSPKCGCTTLKAWCRDSVQVANGQQNGSRIEFHRPLLTPTEIADRRDHWKVFIIRDPLRRLVSFYAHWVVSGSPLWSFADHQRRFSLHGKSFRRMIYVLAHLHQHDLALQHHLVPQLQGTEGIDFDDVIPLENLDAGLASLNSRFGLKLAARHLNRQRYLRQESGPATDLPPEWLRRHGIPDAPKFYDEETRMLASEIFAADIAFYRAATGLEIC